MRRNQQQDPGRTVQRLINYHLIFRFIFLFFLFAICLLASIVPLFADLNQIAFIRKQKQFAAELLREKKYFDCIAETQKLFQYYPGIAKKFEYKYIINACYYLGGQYKTVVSNLKDIDVKSWDRTGLANLVLLSHSYSNLHYYKLSNQVLKDIQYDKIEPTDRKILLKNKIILLLRDFSYDDILGEIENADQHIAGLLEIYSIDELKASINKYRDLGLKSKWLSVSMSAILPGSGQLYSGRIMDGIISFLAVAGTAYGSYYCYKNDEKPLAITLSFFTCLFYAGNLYGAYNSAEYTNLKLKQSFNNQIIQKYNLNYNPEDYINTEILK